MSPVSPENQKIYDDAVRRARENLARHYASPAEHIHVWGVLDLPEASQPWFCFCGEVKG